jgi:glycosyltransferase involved in cell wall biosynthesis
MQLGIAIEETWNFFHEIYAELAKYHQTNVFKRKVFNLPIFDARINKYLFQRDLRNFMRANDVVFFEWASELLAIASHLPKTCGIVTRLHRYEMYQWGDKVNWDAVDKIIFVSQAKRQEFIDKFPAQVEKTIVINEAVDPDKFWFSPRKFNGNIGTLCHLTSRKRVYELLLAFYELIQERDDLHLHIGGPHGDHSDYYYAMHDLIKKLGLQDSITFYGEVTGPWDWYQIIDIFISNSYSEGLQVSPMEAMASGCYCLSHHWAGAEELLPEEYLFYTNTELQEKVLRYCEAPEEIKHQQQARMRAIVCEKFDIYKLRAQIRDVVEEVALDGGWSTT